MSWAAIERRVQEWLVPGWLEGACVRAARRRLPVVASVVPASRRLFIDLSVISRHDAGTGVQRIVRSVAATLIKAPPTGWEVIPVAATRKRGYSPIDWPNATMPLPVAELVAKPGDVFLGLDFALDAVYWHRKQLALLKDRGVRIWFLMHDLLPVQRPAWFSDKTVVRYRRWLRIITGLADGFFCVSPVTADDLRRHCTDRYGLVGPHLPTMEILPIGWDIQYAPHSQGVSPAVEHLLAKLAGQQIALMVGTLEPRKGHADVLAAFDHLWRANENITLVVVGRAGWKTESLQRILRHHPLAEHRLFWLDNASDEEVGHLYAACTGVLAASYAEGFGLPLIEALGHGKPVLARDIPVFHTLSVQGIEYFPAQLAAEPLAASIAKWLGRISQDKHCLQALRLPSWQDTTSHIIQVLAVNH